jgi:sporulation protein YlmC with PRC-barrel domain
MLTGAGSRPNDMRPAGRRLTIKSYETRLTACREKRQLFLRLLRHTGRRSLCIMRLAGNQASHRSIVELTSYGGEGMRTLTLAAVLGISALLPSRAIQAQVAGQATVGVTVEELRLVVLGWSAKHKLLGHDVYNDKNEKLGKVDDIIVSPKRTVSHAIIGVGGFLGLGKKDVAIPMDQMHFEGDKLVLPGASKDVVKAMPAFQYAGL